MHFGEQCVLAATGADQGPASTPARTRRRSGASALVHHRWFESYAHDDKRGVRRRNSGTTVQRSQPSQRARATSARAAGANWVADTRGLEDEPVRWHRQVSPDRRLVGARLSPGRRSLAGRIGRMFRHQPARYTVFVACLFGHQQHCGQSPFRPAKSELARCAAEVRVCRRAGRPLHSWKEKNPSAGSWAFGFFGPTKRSLMDRSQPPGRRWRRTTMNRRHQLPTALGTPSWQTLFRHKELGDR